jgi:hypothetical protein
LTPKTGRQVEIFGGQQLAVNALGQYELPKLPHQQFRFD